ncbi:hypothetical protein E5288_WYG010470 [Bos mutus]|uniref:Uncharacterized protein n=1 Tax=Bos mutus TaxID=72004 RepID=A0A6B0RZB6_9CETA|nr:hypothetical protein [Bos mutus]
MAGSPSSNGEDWLICSKMGGQGGPPEDEATKQSPTCSPWALRFQKYREWVGPETGELEKKMTHLPGACQETGYRYSPLKVLPNGNLNVRLSFLQGEQDSHYPGGVYNQVLQEKCTTCWGNQLELALAENTLVLVTLSEKCLVQNGNHGKRVERERDDRLLKCAICQCSQRSARRGGIRPSQAPEWACQFLTPMEMDTLLKTRMEPSRSFSHKQGGAWTPGFRAFEWGHLRW